MNKILCSKCKCKTCAHTYYFGGEMPDDYCDNCDFCDLDNGYGDYGKLECKKYKVHDSTEREN